MTQTHDSWARLYRTGAAQAWPAEPLVRMAKGNYVPEARNDWSGARVLDVGCGSGNNLLFFGTLGAELYGTEIATDICVRTQQTLQNAGFRASVRIGCNKRLPFDSNYFDCLIAWNVIHYETSDQDILAAIMEYKRVLKVGGRLFLSTTGPRDVILAGAERVAPRVYVIRNPEDFRRGKLYYCFEDKRALLRAFKPHFMEIYVGRTTTFLFTRNMDWFLLSGCK